MFQTYYLVDGLWWRSRAKRNKPLQKFIAREGNKKMQSRLNKMGILIIPAFKPYCVCVFWRFAWQLNQLFEDLHIVTWRSSVILEEINIYNIR